MDSGINWNRELGFSDKELGFSEVRHSVIDKPVWNQQYKLLESMCLYKDYSKWYSYDGFVDVGRNWLCITAHTMHESDGMVLIYYSPAKYDHRIVIQTYIPEQDIMFENHFLTDMSLWRQSSMNRIIEIAWRCAALIARRTDAQSEGKKLYLETGGCTMSKTIK